MSSSAPASRANAWAGTVCVVIAATGFSAKAILIKLAYRWQVDAVTLLALRMALALPFFVVAAWWSTRRASGRIGAREWAALVTLGLSGYYLASLFDFMGLEYISASLERLILFLYPTLVVLLNWAWYRRAPGRREWAALTLSYLGIALVVAGEGVGGQRELAWGVALVFASSLTYAVYLVGSAALIARVGSVRFTALAMTVSCLAVFVHYALAATPPLTALPLPVWWLGLAMALLSTVLPTFLVSEGIRRIGANRASLISSIGPVLTITFGVIFLGEVVRPLQWCGAALVIGGVLLVGLRK
ncbi:threonine/homoserine efflux transporter RhtA [Plasticicumulans lactativorans]|uniref:Threonine/homoserine efflux transporter RhtA n=1 Tax=Plasticicumulans lactativorans TaxID=1133106 RepID=A0A4R2LAF0_9GAMM|nr:DMT family transporter [Plasticicumulans lactativorans]TCO79748.1 threonine/homoserine efflux transporter RhtA [Plasticicumulans lactativorans]